MHREHLAQCMVWLGKHCSSCYYYYISAKKSISIRISISIIIIVDRIIISFRIIISINSISVRLELALVILSLLKLVLLSILEY